MNYCFFNDDQKLCILRENTGRELYGRANK